ncbi:electron transfer flavoprotein subunit beta [Candidatus Bathyarchaeota archaeon]|nr:electron transfer flavoprotein subunit beta [Candidatus Bathyarchaeota archaeon]
MKIITCIKQVPANSTIKIDQVTGHLVREATPAILNPLDKHSIELALEIKESREDVEVIAITMGPDQARLALLEALSMGADKAILLSDIKFAGSDTLATSYTLSIAIKKLMNDDDNYLITCGAQASDGETGHVGPQVAEELGIPSITGASRASLDGDVLLVTRGKQAGKLEQIKTRLPALVTVTKGVNKPRLPTLHGITHAFDEGALLSVWNAATIDADEEKIGMAGSKTKVSKMYTPEPKKENITLTGSPKEIASKLASMLKEKNYI